MKKRKTFVIRLNVEVGSEDEKLLEFISTKTSRIFSKTQMVILALKAFWMTDAVHQTGKKEDAIATFNKSKYLWTLHEDYLKKIVGITTLVDSSVSHSAPVQPTPDEITEIQEDNPFGDVVKRF
ncbi:hypothetical protein VB735_18430 [Halotia wernerae UHCC 0503]|nr:hypothetical protein [Halotia wernerae UHCC 0503]